MCRTKNRLAANDMVARTQQRCKSGINRCHACGKSISRFSTFEFHHFFGKLVDIGIRKTAV